MFKKIIVATDLSEASYALTKCLVGLRKLGAEECLLLQLLVDRKRHQFHFCIYAVIKEHLFFRDGGKN